MFKQSNLLVNKGPLSMDWLWDIQGMWSLTSPDGITGHGCLLSTMYTIERKPADYTAMIFCMRVKYHISINLQYSRCLVYLLLSAVGEGAMSSG
jgi:hypothetical protein